MRFKTSYVSPLLVFLPYHEPSRSIKYLLFFFTSLSNSYSLYKFISITWLFPLMTWNIYRDISNNFHFSTRKSNITIIYQFKKCYMQYSIKKNKSILIRNLGHFSTISTLEQIPLSQSSISPWHRLFVSYPHERTINSTFNWNSFYLHLVCSIIFFFLPKLFNLELWYQFVVPIEALMLVCWTTRSFHANNINSRT